VAKKSSNLILRVSVEWKKELQKICENKGRSMTGHIEHSFKLAKLVTDFCGGNDDLVHVERYLRELRQPPAKPALFPDIKPQFIVAAEGERSVKIPAPEKKITYKKDKK
jgi:hypothetical protein